MDANGLPLIGIGIDLHKVEAIQPKRTLAFLNHFVTHTVAFLNRFSAVCEEKLETLTVRIDRLETTMFILEAKLASIPGLETINLGPTSSSTSPQSAAPAVGVGTSTPQSTSDISSSTTQRATTTTSSVTTTQVHNVSSQETVGAEVDGEEAESRDAVVDDPQYAKYKQLMRMGVPLAAFRQKLIGEGLDPNVLEALNAAGAPPNTSPSRPVGASPQDDAYKDKQKDTAPTRTPAPTEDDFSDFDDQSNSSNNEEQEEEQEVISDFED